MLAALGGLAFVLILGVLDPALWAWIAASSAERRDRKKRDLHIWQRTEM